MSTPINIQNQDGNEKRKSGDGFAVPHTPPKQSPRHHPYGSGQQRHSLTIPSPIPCRRTRTTSVYLKS